MKGNCGECERRWFCDINPDECDAWPDPVPMTNADHIRSMTDEELVNVVPCPLGFSMFRCTAEKPCGICKREWLKQPYKEDA